MSARTRFRRVAVLAAGLLPVACAAAAQSRAIDLNALSLDWARGAYLSPVICATGDELVRGGRKVEIAPGPRHRRPPVGRLELHDLEVETADRCFDELGRPQPNVIGALEFRHPGRSRPDTASRDFRTALKRDRGFEYHVARGRLRIVTVGGDDEREVDFRGGVVRLHEVGRGSDEARVLGDLVGLRKLLLELESPGGERLQMPLLMTEPL